MRLNHMRVLTAIALVAGAAGISAAQSGPTDTRRPDAAKAAPAPTPTPTPTTDSVCTCWSDDENKLVDCPCD